MLRKVIFIIWVVLCGGTSLLYAEVFYAKDEALKLAFPGADSVEPHTSILSEAQVRAVEEAARARVESKLFTFFIGKARGEILGYAAIDTHTVRTMSESIMVVLSPQGEIQKVVVLAFHEPPEYMVSDRWLAQFKGESPAGLPSSAHKIQGILGSTLSVQAVGAGVRKVLAMYSVLIKKG